MSCSNVMSCGNILQPDGVLSLQSCYAGYGNISPENSRDNCWFHLAAVTLVDVIARAELARLGVHANRRPEERANAACIRGLIAQRLKQRSGRHLRHRYRIHHIAVMKV